MNINETYLAGVLKQGKSTKDIFGVRWQGHNLRLALGYCDDVQLDF